MATVKKFIKLINHYWRTYRSKVAVREVFNVRLTEALGEGNIYRWYSEDVPVIPEHSIEGWYISPPVSGGFYFKVIDTYYNTRVVVFNPSVPDFMCEIKIKPYSEFWGLLYLMRESCNQRHLKDYG